MNLYFLLLQFSAPWRNHLVLVNLGFSLQCYFSEHFNNINLLHELHNGNCHVDSVLYHVHGMQSLLWLLPKIPAKNKTGKKKSFFFQFLHFGTMRGSNNEQGFNICYCLNEDLMKFSRAAKNNYNVFTSASNLPVYNKLRLLTFTCNF